MKKTHAQDKYTTAAYERAHPEKVKQPEPKFTIFRRSENMRPPKKGK